MIRYTFTYCFFVFLSLKLIDIWLTVALDCELKGLTFDIKDFHDLGIHVNAIDDVSNNYNFSKFLLLFFYLTLQQFIFQLNIEGVPEDAANAIAKFIPEFINQNYQEYVETHKETILAILNEILGTIV